MLGVSAVALNALPVALFNDIMEGKLSREQLKEEVRQEGIIPLHNHNYHGRLYVVCPDPKWRARIAEVCFEEGTGRLYANGFSHNDLYLRFGEALGISRDEMWSTRYCAGALALKAYFSDICRRSFLEGVSAHMLAGEAPAPAHVGSRGDAPVPALRPFSGRRDVFHCPRGG